MLSRVTFQPGPWTYGDDEYELRFSYSGYMGDHMEPRYKFWGLHAPPILTDVEAMQAVMRDGSTDHIQLQICGRVYSLSGIYIDCRVDSLGVYDFKPSDNGREVSVPFALHDGDSDMRGTFLITLSWTPVNIQPASIGLYPRDLTLDLGGPGQGLDASALDLNGQAVPGLPITWTSSNPAVATVTSTGWVTPVSPGSATVTATVSGVSGSVPVVVNTSGISLDIIGPDAAQPYDYCNYSVNILTTGLSYPLSYSWRGPDNSASSESTFFAGGTANSSFIVDVTVTDAGGRSGTATKRVNVNSNNPACLQ